MSRPLILLLAVCAAGCFVPATMPDRQDPFAGMGLAPAGAPYPQLAVALVSSANTKESVAFGHRAMAGKVTDDWLRGEAELFKRNFGKVFSAGSIAEGWAGGADLVAVYDVYDETFRSCKYDETLVFLRKDGGEVARVSASVDVPFTGFGVNKVLKACIAEMQGKIERGLREAAGLRAFAAAKSPAAAPAAAAGLPPVLRPERSVPADPSAFALVVGVEKYSRIPPADHAERDAEAAREHFLALGVPRRNLVHLAGADASYSALAKYLESWLPKNVPAGGRVFVFFSGHGAPDTGTGEAYLLPWDGDPAFLKDTAYPTRRLFDRLAALPAREVVVALDACFSGAGGRSVLAKGARPLVTSVETGPVPSGALAVFSASGPDQVTGTLDEAGHGLFTYFFLKGLGGEARGPDGRVTPAGLRDYLVPRVQDEARRQNRDQTPLLRGGSERELVRYGER